MSVVEESIKPKEISKPKTAPILNRILDFLSSVRFGIVLLCILVFLSVLGMLIIQQNVQGFDASYSMRTPAEKLIYGALGLFDISHSWYYSGLLLLLSLNIILASIDRFPSALKYIAEPKLTATRGWLLNQKSNAVVSINGSDEADVARKARLRGAALLDAGLDTGERALHERRTACDLALQHIRPVLDAIER